MDLVQIGGGARHVDQILVRQAQMVGVADDFQPGEVAEIDSGGVERWDDCPLVDGFDLRRFEIDGEEFQG